MACLLLLIGMLPVRTAAEGEDDPAPEGPTPITEITLIGVSVPSGLAGGSSLGLNPGTAAGNTPVHVVDAAILKSSDDGEEDPYARTEDTTAETGIYYRGQIVLEANEGFVIAEGVSVRLLRDAEDEESSVPYSGLSVGENGQQLVISFAFGQAGEKEEPEPVPAEPTDLGRIDIYVTNAEPGKAPVKPEDRLVTTDDGRPAYMLIFKNWTGSFDEAGNFKEAETYNLPITVAVMPDFIIGPKTEIYVNDICLFAKNAEHYYSQFEVYYSSTTADLPDSYPITLLNNEHVTLSSSTENWETISESVAGQAVLISVYPSEGYFVNSISIVKTNDPQVTMTAELLNEEGTSKVFRFVMPDYAVTVSAVLTGPPKAQTPNAQFKVTGPSSGLLTNVEPGMKWSQDGSNYTQILGETEVIPEILPGMLYIVRSGDGVQTTDSDPQVITVSKAPAPTQLTATACTTEDNNDGIISGLEVGMEWRATGEEDFTEVDEGETQLTGLTPGTYEFRYHYTEAMLASDIIIVRVEEYKTDEPDDPSDPSEPDEPVETYYNITLSGATAYDAEGVKINKAQENDIIRIKADDMDGKVFESWNVWTTNEAGDEEIVALADPESPETTFVMPARDVNVFAQFKEEEDRGYEYIVVFIGNGADEGAMDYQVFYEKEAQQLNLNRYVRKGYTFLGWSRTENGEVEFEDGAVITEPLVEKGVQACTLYAVWQDDAPPPEVYKILVSGGIAYVDGEEVSSAEVGTKVTIIAEEKEGKVFLKWLDNDNLISDPENAETSFIMPDKDVVIMAQFEDYIDRGFEYAVEFDGNGADEGEMEDQTFYEKEEQTLNLNEYTREGYTFLGWARSPEAEEPEFEDGANITEPLVDKEGRIRTLYAVWAEEKEEESQPTSKEAEEEPSESQTQPTQPTQPPTNPPTQPTPTAHQESWTSPTNPSAQSSSEQADVPVVVVTTDDEETEVETPEAETEESITDREPSSSDTPTVPPSSESTEKEEQAVKRIRLVLGIAIGVVAAAIIVAVVFYQREKRRHGSLL